jgi:hypothetical protein
MRELAEKRQTPRTNILCRIKISHRSFGEKIVNTRDMSEDGLFVLLDPTILPRAGTVVKAWVLGLNTSGQELALRIVRCEEHGAGFEFVRAVY